MSQSLPDAVSIIRQIEALWRDLHLISCNNFNEPQMQRLACTMEDSSHFRKAMREVREVLRMRYDEEENCLPT